MGSMGPGEIGMVAVAFDSLKMMQSLRQRSAFTSEQAEALAVAFSSAVSDDLATTRDVESTRADLSKTIELTRADLSRTIELTRADLSKTIELTKADLSKTIELTKADLLKTIELTKTDLLKTIAETKGDLLKWTFGAIGFQTLVVVGAIVALSHR